MNAFSIFYLLGSLAVLAVPAAVAGNIVPTPELDSGTLTALVSGISGAYLTVRLFKLRHHK